MSYGQILLSTILLTLLGCPEVKTRPTPLAPQPTPEVIPTDPVEKADYVFRRRCSACHGKYGRGDGLAAQNVEPRNFTDVAWQANTSDDTIKKVITGGGPAIGKSIEMKAYPEYAGEAELLEALVRKIRSFSGSGDDPVPEEESE